MLHYARLNCAQGTYELHAGLHHGMPVLQSKAILLHNGIELATCMKKCNVSQGCSALAT